MNTLNKDFRETRGSIMITAIIFATIAAIMIGSYIRLASTEARFANSQFYSNASLNLAEAGIEEALFGINLSSLADQGWSAAGVPNAMEKIVPNVQLGNGAVGTFRVHVIGYGSSAPRVVSEGEVVSGLNGRNVRQVEVLLFSRSLFANGILADNIVMNGNNIEVRSIDAETGEVSDGAKVAGASIEEGSVDLGNADIYGSVATRGWDLSVKKNTLVTGDITNDFSSDLPDVKLPDYENGHIYDGGPGTLGTEGSTTYYYASNIDLKSSDQLLIEGDVVIIVENDIDIGGNTAGIVLASGASLKIYVEGDVSISGSGIVNTSEEPANLQLFGTNLDSQTIRLQGNAAWHGTVYAPNADVRLGGGGSSGVFYGAVVGGSVTLNGGVKFFYDEKLADLVDGASWGMANWRELFGNNRYAFN